MTPQLQQAIKLLQLSNLELSEFCELELEKNPLLERDESGGAAPGEAGPEVSDIPADSGVPEPLETALAREDFAKADEMDVAREDMFEAPDTGEPERAASQEPSYDGGTATDWGRPARGPGDESFIEATVSEAGTLKDHLQAQLSIAGLDGARRLIAVALIDAIDEAGYLRLDPAELAARLGAPTEQILDVLQVVQGFEPVGVGARDLAECLALQLKERDHLDPAMQALLDRLDLVARRDVAALCEACGVDAEDIADMIAEIRSLSPRPGLAFGSEPVQPVVPDVIVRKGHDGMWQVELNTDTLPHLLVNARYFAEVSATARDKDSKSYLTECLNSANWLVKSLDQRARTILKVSSEIVRQQDGFLNHGVRFLRPLNLRAIADAIGMHESTVSRVTSNKYITTPRGLFELKYFFTAAIQSVNGIEAHSAEAVRDRIREMIDNEKSGDILSDDRIVALLTADGVNIARRTVAKYREAMHIASSVERRRMKAENATA